MIATYRLQLRPDFGFAAVEDLLPYFQQLGVSHLYLSPIMEARPGSSHGYDVINHNALRDELGGREGFASLRAAAADAGLGLILDFVPNHAGVGPFNDSWQDVLAYGPNSAYSHYFDIDWAPLKPELRGKILLPFLGQLYGDALDDGEIEVAFADGRFYAQYYDDRFALTPQTYGALLDRIRAQFERTDTYFDLKDLQDAYERLEPGEREKAETLRARLNALSEEIDFEDALSDLEPAALHDLLEQQHWRLAYWKTASYEINYRRFFDINGLVALRMEDEQVFWDAHRLLGELLTEEGVDGVRIDHVDGLTDPHQYLDRLHELGAEHIWVEKILAPGETLPDDWPVDGATGYRFMNDAMGVLLHPDGETPLQRIYRRFVPDAQPFEEAVYQSKRLIIATKLSSELFRLAYELDRLSEANYHTRDFTLGALREALTEIVAAIDRYRTYLPHAPDEAEDVIHQAVRRALQRNPAAEPTVFEFIERVIVGDVPAQLSAARQAWVGRFQQYTAPVAAKGVEDTAFYRHVPLAALNEVGGEPEPFGVTPHAFHARARFRARQYPKALLATATHDHKRGEDTRMRLIALAERPDLWDETVHALDEIGQPYKGQHGPARSDAYLFYQMLIALWPEAALDADSDASGEVSLTDRLWTYMQKASRESKQHTSWINPNEAYEDDLEAFVLGVVTDQKTADVLDAPAATLAEDGFFNGLSQLVLKGTAPGVPDFYRGTELLDLSLVDPDNRRPVDYSRRRALLEALQPLLDAPDAEQLRTLWHKQAPRLKFYVMAQLLRLRNTHPSLFAEGNYTAVEPEGEGADHWIAFARHHEDAALVAAVPRFPATFNPATPATLPLPDALVDRTWTEWLTGTAHAPGADWALHTGPLPWTVLVHASA